MSTLEVCLLKIIYGLVPSTRMALSSHLRLSRRLFGYVTTDIKGEPELTDPFNLLINVKLRML